MSRFFLSGPQQTYSRNQTGGVPRLGSDANLNAPGIDPGTLASHSEGLRRAEELGRILGLAGSAASEIGQAYQMQGYIDRQQRSDIERTVAEQQQLANAAERKARLLRASNQGFGTQTAQEKSPLTESAIGTSTVVLPVDQIPAHVNAMIDAEITGLNPDAAKAYRDYAAPRYTAAAVNRNEQLVAQARKDTSKNILAGASGITDAQAFTEKVDALAEVNPGVDRAVLERSVGAAALNYQASIGSKSGFDAVASLLPAGFDKADIEQARSTLDASQRQERAKIIQQSQDDLAGDLAKAIDNTMTFEMVKEQYKQRWKGKIGDEAYLAGLNKIDAEKSQANAGKAAMAVRQFKQDFRASKASEVGTLMDTGKPIPSSFTMEMPDGSEHVVNTAPLVQEHLGSVFDALGKQFPTTTADPKVNATNQVVRTQAFATYLGKLPPDVKYEPWSDVLSSSESMAVNSAGEPSPQAMEGIRLFQLIEQSQNPGVAERHAGKALDYLRASDLLSKTGRGPDGGPLTLPEAAAAAARVVRVGKLNPSVDAKPVVEAVNAIASKFGATNHSEIEQMFVRQAGAYAALTGQDPTSKAVLDRVSSNLVADMAVVDNRLMYARGNDAIRPYLQPIADAMRELNRGVGQFRYDAASRTATLDNNGVPIIDAPALTTGEMHAISNAVTNYGYISAYRGKDKSYREQRQQALVDRMPPTAKSVYDKIVNRPTLNDSLVSPANKPNWAWGLPNQQPSPSRDTGYYPVGGV